MIRSSLRLGVTAGLLLLVPSAALAATDVATTRARVSALALAGSEVLYATPPPAGGTHVLSAAPGRAPSLVLELPRVSEEDSVDLGASPAGLALARSPRSNEAARSEILSARLEGQFERLASCEGDPGRVAVDGGLLAVVGADCRSDQVVVREAGPGGPVIRVSPGGANALALGGRWLARTSERLEGGRVNRVVRVEDARTGEPLTELSLPDLLFGLDVQADGTAAIVRQGPSSGCSERVSVIAPRGAGPRDLTGPGCFARGVRIAGDRVAYFREVGREGGELVLSDLSGAGVRAVARFPDEGQMGGFDYDGERIAWSESRCLGGEVIRLGGAADDGPPSQAPRCSPRVGTSLRVSGRHARVRLSCPSGCAGLLRVQRPSYLQAGRSPRFRLRAGRSATVHVALSRRGLATVRRRGRLAVTISAEGEGFVRETRAVVRAR